MCRETFLGLSPRRKGREAPIQLNEKVDILFRQTVNFLKEKFEVLRVHKGGDPY
jgi:hypothetical protein